MIIGLTGSYAAGKDTVAAYLVKKGYGYHSLSDLIREDLKTQNLPITRENLIQAGNQIRKKYGAGEWARRILRRIAEKSEKKSLVVSIRNPEEVRVLRNSGEFELWFVDAPMRLRYERAKKRQRSDDFSSLNEFIEKETQENSSDPAAQQLVEVAKLADKKILNDSSLDTLFKNIEKNIP